jgi:hypothetical protein
VPNFISEIPGVWFRVYLKPQTPDKLFAFPPSLAVN